MSQALNMPWIKLLENDGQNSGKFFGRKAGVGNRKVIYFYFCLREMTIGGKKSGWKGWNTVTFFVFCVAKACGARQFKLRSQDLYDIQAWIEGIYTFEHGCTDEVLCSFLHWASEQYEWIYHKRRWIIFYFCHIKRYVSAMTMGKDANGWLMAIFLPVGSAETNDFIIQFIGSIFSFLFL